MVWGFQHNFIFLPSCHDLHHPRRWWRSINLLNVDSQSSLAGGGPGGRAAGGAGGITGGCTGLAFGFGRGGGGGGMLAAGGLQGQRFKRTNSWALTRTSTLIASLTWLFSNLTGGTAFNLTQKNTSWNFVWTLMMLHHHQHHSHSQLPAIPCVAFGVPQRRCPHFSSAACQLQASRETAKINHVRDDCGTRGKWPSQVNTYTCKTGKP